MMTSLQTNMAGVLLVICAIIATVHSANDIRGHLEHLGAHTDPDKVDEMVGAPDGDVFLNEYVNKLKPLLMRQSHKSLGIERWDDDYLIKNYGDEYLRLEPKKEKESEGLEVMDRFAIPLREYMTTYKNDVYVVSQIPAPMEDEFELPRTMGCEPFKDSLLETNVWISTGETSSSLHKDAFNTINCQIKGTKEWILIDHKHVRNVPIAKEGDTDPNTETAGFSLLNPKKVDLKKYPKLRKVPWMNVSMTPGDCLFLPGSMLHQVRSSKGYNIACTVMFSGPTSANRHTKGVRMFGKPNATQCAQVTGGIPSNLADIAWRYDGKGKASMTMGFEDPDSVRRRWVEYANGGRKIDRTKFRKYMKSLIADRVSEGLDDRHKSSAFDVAAMTKKAIDEAETMIFNQLAGDKGHITKKDILESPRNLWKNGMETFIRIDYMHSLYDGSANEEYAQQRGEGKEGGGGGGGGRSRGRDDDEDEDDMFQQQGGRGDEDEENDGWGDDGDDGDDAAWEADTERSRVNDNDDDEPRRRQQRSGGGGGRGGGDDADDDEDWGEDTPVKTSTSTNKKTTTTTTKKATTRKSRVEDDDAWGDDGDNTKARGGGDGGGDEGEDDDSEDAWDSAPNFHDEL